MLKLPLHQYDESGRVKPPMWLYFVLVFGLKDWILLVFALASRQHTENLMQLFYPKAAVFEWNFVAAFPFVVVFLALGFREKLWKSARIRWAFFIRPLIILGLLIQIAMVGQSIAQSFGMFNLANGIVLILAILCFASILRSYHLKVMIEDWLLE